jgi:nucleotide-binding universal stress UspA family protein
MKNIQILVPLDGSVNSFRGLDTAIYFARQYHATLTGLYIIPMVKPSKSDPITSMEKMFLENAAKFMRKAKTLAAKNGILFFDRVVYGDSGPEIVRFAKKNKFDFIVIGSRGHGEVADVFLGSISNYVLHKSNIPIIILK